MSKLVQSAFIVAFFGLLACNTLWRPFDAWNIQSGPLRILQGIVDKLLVSWMGAPLAAAVLVALVPLVLIRLFTREDHISAAEPPPSGRPAQTLTQPRARQFGRR
jgi:hypothetical protein